MVSLLFKHQNVEFTHGQILLPPDKNFGEELPELQCASSSQALPPGSYRRSESPGKITTT
jgi:hypothetical protein